MSEKWLYLPIEVITRELDAKLLLIYYAVKQKYNVILAKQHKLYRNMDHLPKGIFISKGYPPNKKGPLFEAKKLGHAIVELDEEGLIIDREGYTSHRINEEYFHMLDHLYCWGEETRNIVVKAFGNPGKVYLTGHPRFDLVKEKFLSIYSDEVQILKKKYGDFILINTRFGKYNHRNQRKRFNPKHDFIKDLYEHFIKMIKELSQSYPNCNIVVRPHPRENFDSYQEEFKNDKNVFIVHEGNVVKWNLASKVVIHNGCTTGIEAFLLNHLVISYMPITSNKHTAEYLPNAVSVKAVNLTELKTFIDSCFSKENNIKIDKQQSINERKEILSKFYAALDENYAYKNIISFLDRLNIKAEPPLLEPQLQISPNENDTEIENDTSEITIKQLKKFFNKLNEIERNENELIVRKIERNFFVIKGTNY